MTTLTIRPQRARPTARPCASAMRSSVCPSATRTTTKPMAASTTSSAASSTSPGITDGSTGIAVAFTRSNPRSPGWDSNPRPAVYETAALPIELPWASGQRFPIPRDAAASRIRAVRPRAQESGASYGHPGARPPLRLKDNPQAGALTSRPSALARRRLSGPLRRRSRRAALAATAAAGSRRAR